MRKEKSAGNHVVNTPTKNSRPQSPSHARSGGQLAHIAGILRRAQFWARPMNLGGVKRARRGLKSAKIAKYRVYRVISHIIAKYRGDNIVKGYDQGRDDPVAREPASSTSIAQSDHPHGPTSASCAEVNNTSRTRVLHTRYWPYSVSRFTKATTCMQRFAPCEQKSSVVCILRPWRGAACSHDHEVFTAGSFMLTQLG